MAKLVHDMLETLSWEVLTYAVYSPDCAPSDYHLFAEQCFSLYKDIKTMAQGMVHGKRGKFFSNIVFINCPKYGENV